MPAYHVERSIRIDAPKSKVRPAIENFAEWPKWSPWLCMERTANLNVHGTPGQVGHGYDWTGELVGAGSMKIVAIDGDTQTMDLEFLKPFRSKADVKIEVNSQGENQTDVKWHMDGKMPFFLFFMIGMMKSMIGMDFARGLKMLKEHVETGEVKSETEIKGVVDFPGTHYVGVEDHCTMDQIGDSMARTIPAAFKTATDNGLEMSGMPGAIYNKVDLKNQDFHYTAIAPVKSSGDLAEGTATLGAKTGSIPPCKALKVVHRGKYEHLGNAWSTLMSLQRNKKHKPLRAQPPFEIYMNDPGETPEEDLLTEIYLPIRS